MTFYIKPEFVDVIINNKEVSFDGAKQYSQYQLSNMFKHPKYRKFVDFHDDIHTESNIDMNKSIETKIEYVKLVHPRNYSNEEELKAYSNEEELKAELEDVVEDYKSVDLAKLSLKELRELFPYIKANSKAKFLEQI